jgi:hypothetical protein
MNPFLTRLIASFKGLPSRLRQFCLYLTISLRILCLIRIFLASPQLVLVDSRPALTYFAFNRL